MKIPKNIYTLAGSHGSIDFVVFSYCDIFGAYMRDTNSVGSIDGYHGSTEAHIQDFYRSRKSISVM